MFKTVILFSKGTDKFQFMNPLFTNTIRRRFILLLLPVFYVFLSLVILKNITTFYINGPDPVYAYLMNATNLAGGHLEIGHIDHPGTPVQCFGAAVVFAKYMISGSLPLYQDVLSNPESYLYACSMTLLMLFMATLYLTGRYVYTKTGNIYMALLFQATPLFNTGILHHAFLLTPEAMIIIANTFFTAWLYVTAVHVNRSGNPNWSLRALVTAAVFSALIVACKITCLPLIVLVYFLIRSNKQRLLFTGGFVVSFLIFILPAISKFREMYTWIKGLLNHDGHYGHGKEQILNTAEFKQNLHTLFATNAAFTAIYAVITFAFGVCLYRLIRKKSADRFQLRFISGIWVSITLLILLVAKHYSFHYLIPAETFFPLGLIVSYMIFSPFLDLGLYSRNTRAVKTIIACALALLLARQNVSAAFLFPDHRNPMLSTQQFLSSWKDTPMIITPGNESSCIETAIYFGTVYSGTMNHPYFQFIKTLFPHSYHYEIGTKRLMFWDVDMFAPEILRKQSKVLVYFKNETLETEIAAMTDISMLNGKVKLGDFKKIFTNPLSDESIYLIDADTALSARIASGSTTIFCNLEKRTDDKTDFIAEDGHTHFKKAEELNHDQYFSGNTCVKLNEKTQYGLDCEFPVQPGDFVDATVWRRSTDNTGTIILSAKNNALFYTGGEAIINNAPGDWQQIQCRTKIPDNYPEKTLFFYMYYTGKGTAWIDDVKITVYPCK